MPVTNTASQYGGITKVFHWVTALLIFAVIPLGVIANQLPYETNEQLAFKALLFSAHKTLGVIIFGIACARILWALFQTKPGTLHQNRRVEIFLAQGVHWLLYISLVAVPLTGWIHHASTTGFAPILLPIGQDLPLVPKSETLAATTAMLHWLWSKIMVGAILLHVAGALKHQFVDKDATLRRMWIGTNADPDVAAHRSSYTAPICAIALFFIAAGGGAAIGLYSKDHAVPQAARLEQVNSGWAVQDGTIEIEVTQFGEPVTGIFEDWTANIQFDPTAVKEVGYVQTVIAIGSLSLGSVTDQAMSKDFFDASAYPTATFEADIVRNANSFAAVGTLSIKGTTVPLTLPFDLVIEGNQAKMSGSLALDRRDFAIGQSMTDETNVGFAVEVAISVTATQT